jgi:hypothetical protein
MAEEKSFSGQKKLQKWYLIEMVEGGKITLKEASERGES